MLDVLRLEQEFNEGSSFSLGNHIHLIVLGVGIWDGLWRIHRSTTGAGGAFTTEGTAWVKTVYLRNDNLFSESEGGGNQGRWQLIRLDGEQRSFFLMLMGAASEKWPRQQSFLHEKMSLSLGRPSEGLLGTVSIGGDEQFYQSKNSGKEEGTESKLPPLKVCCII